MQSNRRYLIFKLAGEFYGIAFENFREVFPHRDSTPVPFAPEFIQGVVNLRGKIITIVDLYLLFGLPGQKGSGENSTIVLEWQDQLIGISADSVEQVIELPEQQIDQPPIFSNNLLNHFAEAITRIDRQFIVILSTEKLFSFEEMVVPAAERSPVAAA